MNENIAEVSFDPKTKRILKTIFSQNNLRFKCKRCAIFCCKLGGPKFTEKDVERLGQASFRLENSFGTTSDSKFTDLPMLLGNLKSSEGGSCIFLQPSLRKGVYECSIYDSRPALCRLYPFHFKRTSPNSFILKVIPCCMGLNNADGETVDEKLIVNHLFDPILESL